MNPTNSQNLFSLDFLPADAHICLLCTNLDYFLLCCRVNVAIYCLLCCCFPKVMLCEKRLEVLRQFFLQYKFWGKGLYISFGSNDTQLQNAFNVIAAQLMITFTWTTQIEELDEDAGPSSMHCSSFANFW